MKNKKKIGWQKYEDHIEQQLSSPVLQTIIQNIAMQNLDVENQEEDEEFEEDLAKATSVVPLTSQLVNDISMMSSFDCWIGHTNFDVTHSIKEKLDKVPGIELLKIYSRYRFFVGIGQMFDFTKVRNDIEKAITGEIE
jgi:hypothetical protein